MADCLIGLAESATENARLRAALEAVLLFHSGGAWDAEKATRWSDITGTPTCTARKLCDHIRAVLDGKDHAEQGGE